MSIVVYNENRSSQVNSTETDYKAEVIAAGLIEKGMSAENIRIIREGDSARGYSKDIAYVRMEQLFRNKSSYLCIGVNRQSLYDMLPEGIFHKVKGTPFLKTKQEILDEIKLARQEEQFARIFFRPIEISMDNLLVNAQLYERKIDKKCTNPNFVNIFTRYWPILAMLNLDKAVLFMEIISAIANLPYDTEFAGQIISALLATPVKIKMGKKRKICIYKTVVPPMRDMKLGINSIIGNTFEEEHQRIVVHIGPMPIDKIIYYNKNETGRKIIDSLIAIFFPADREVYFNFIPQPKDACCLIASDRSKSSFLGINSFIHKKRNK